MSVYFNVDDFYQTLRKHINLSNNVFSNKILCFDYGTHKIGVAISDDNLNFSFPKDILIGGWIDVDVSFEKIKNYCDVFNIKFIVFGFPKKMDNSLNDNCYRIMEIANKLSSEDKEILLFDERFSTKLTNSIERFEKSRDSKNRKNNVKKINQKYDDASAASVILNDVLSIIKQKFN